MLLALLKRLVCDETMITTTGVFERYVSVMRSFSVIFAWKFECSVCVFDVPPRILLKILEEISLAIHSRQLFFSDINERNV